MLYLEFKQPDFHKLCWWPCDVFLLSTLWDQNIHFWIRKCKCFFNFNNLMTFTVTSTLRHYTFCHMIHKALNGDNLCDTLQYMTHISAATTNQIRTAGKLVGQDSTLYYHVQGNQEHRDFFFWSGKLFSHKAVNLWITQPKNELRRATEHKFGSNAFFKGYKHVLGFQIKWKKNKIVSEI